MVDRIPVIILIFLGIGGIFLTSSKDSYFKEDVESKSNNNVVSEQVSPVEPSDDNADLPESEKQIETPSVKNIKEAIQQDEVINANNDKLSNSEQYDSIPFRHLPLKEQLKKSKRFHTYGDLKLGGGPLNYFFDDYEKGVSIRENYPNILNYWYSVAKNEENQKAYSGFKVEFYNSDKTLRKEINLEKETPYTNDRFNIIQRGAPDMEHYKPPSRKYSGVGDLEYITFNEISTDPNGFTVLQYQLLSISGSIIIDWEETLTIYDRNGALLGKLKVAHDVYDCWVSNDGKKIAFLYGGEYTSHPNNMSGGAFRIYEIESSELLYEQKAELGESFEVLKEIENGFLGLGISTNKPQKIYTYFDLENSVKYSREFTRSELMEMSKTPWLGFVNILKNYPFEKEKF